MTIYIPVKVLIFAGVAVGTAICMWISTVWLMADNALNIQGDKLRKYQVFTEVTVTKEVAVVFADSEEEAVERVSNITESIIKGLGSDGAEMIWAEEIK